MKIKQKLLKRILQNLDKLRNGGVSAIESNCDTEENSQAFLGAITGFANSIMSPFNERMEEMGVRQEFSIGEADEEVYEEWIKHLVGCFALLGISEAIAMCQSKKEIGTIDDVLTKRPGWSKERAELWFEQNQDSINSRLADAFKTIVGQLLEEQKR